MLVDLAPSLNTLQGLNRAAGDRRAQEGGLRVVLALYSNILVSLQDSNTRLLSGTRAFIPAFFPPSRQIIKSDAPLG